MKIVVKAIGSILLGGLLAIPLPAQAVRIEYELATLGSNSYRYDYTVVNDGSLGAGTALQIFDILFDPALYQEASLTIVTPTPPAADWKETLLPSTPLIGEPNAVYDVQALSGGIPVGASVSDFAVAFTWLGGTGGPGTQPFQIYDPQTFALLAEGTPQGQSPPCTVCPVPGTRSLLGLGLWSLALVRWRRPVP